MYKAIFLVTNLENKNIVPICHGYPQNVMIYSQDINNIHSFLETISTWTEMKAGFNQFVMNIQIIRLCLKFSIDTCIRITKG